mmetsp:Transcript_36135/g.115856  ORF Transcript_36135/g.115856 Transcript_36135/m.115856 type:complete len:372 (+) Transcript_36135:240-1355(+)
MAGAIAMGSDVFRDQLRCLKLGLAEWRLNESDVEDRPLSEYSDLLARHRAVDKELSRERRRDWREHRAELVIRLSQAVTARNYSGAWRLAHAIAGQKMSIKRRRVSMPPSMTVLLERWTSHLAKAGAEGGYSTSCVWRSEEMPHEQAILRLGRARAPLVSDLLRRKGFEGHGASDPAAVAARDWVGLEAALRKANTRKACPGWSLPVDAWKDAMLPREGVPEAANFGRLIRDFHTVMRARGRPPTQWQFGKLCLLSKNKAPDDPTGYRPVNLVDAFGKCWYSQLWCQRPPDVSPNSSGYVEGATREDAILRTLLGMYHMNQAGLPCCPVLWDASNAFGSLRYECLERTERKVAQSDAPFLGHRRHGDVFVV